MLAQQCIHAVNLYKIRILAAPLFVALPPPRVPNCQLWTPRRNPKEQPRPAPFPPYTHPLLHGPTPRPILTGPRPDPWTRRTRSRAQVDRIISHHRRRTPRLRARLHPLATAAPPHLDGPHLSGVRDARVSLLALVRAAVHHAEGRLHFPPSHLPLSLLLVAKDSIHRETRRSREAPPRGGETYPYLFFSLRSIQSAPIRAPRLHFARLGLGFRSIGLGFHLV